MAGIIQTPAHQDKLGRRAVQIAEAYMPRVVDSVAMTVLVLTIVVLYGRMVPMTVSGCVGCYTYLPARDAADAYHRYLYCLGRQSTVIPSPNESCAAYSPFSVLSVLRCTACLPRKWFRNRIARNARNVLRFNGAVRFDSMRSFNVRCSWNCIVPYIYGSTLSYKSLSGWLVGLVTFRLSPWLFNARQSTILRLTE